MTSPRRTEREVSRTLRLDRAARGVDELRRAALAAEQEFAAQLDAVAPAMRESAYNLVHYLAVRRLDVRELQKELTQLGLSSLGRMEAHVMASLNAVLEALHVLRNQPVPKEITEAAPIGFDNGDALLSEHADAILGHPRRGRRTRIMVTMPGEAADQPALIHDLVEAGMDVMRINCAHDEPKVWGRMIKHLRRAERDSGKRCALSFDLAGPKLRTGPIESGPAVAKWRPVRDRVGRVTEPARVRFVAQMHESDADDATIPVDGDFTKQARPGDTIQLTDTRGRKRLLKVIEGRAGECLCETDTTAYVVPGTHLLLRRKSRIVAKGMVGALPALEQWIALRPGDTLDVVRGEMPGRDAIHDEDG
ncbi:MAG: pyruvate kinase, partial [Betaproteobacteria bacterium]|nr:pyruvate kinase [Betaproteobacteria bacterium]